MLPENDVDNQTETNEETVEEKGKPLSLALAWLGFLPLLGLLFAPIALVLGLIFKGKREKARKLFKVGAVGLAWQLLFIGVLYYFVFIQAGVLKDQFDAWQAEREKQAIKEQTLDQLNQYVAMLSAYREEHNEYPPRVFFTKKSITKQPEMEDHPYYYERRKNLTSYYLLAVGEDGYPFTSDDLVPTMTDPEEGLKIHPLSIK